MNASEIFRKLRLERSMKILIMNAPDEFEALLTGVNYDREYREVHKNGFDFILIFTTTMKELEELLRKAGNAGKYDCLFWICYPKGGSKIKSDIKRDKAWTALEIINLRPVTMIAIDETWSAMRGRPPGEVGK
jgi:hypothetical protein